ncbi:hypothetical protein KC957_01665 [Candidatus Saccharibacteria bacterium]|nr:hypothetical protein [Candidatus Saccharibacteria bacterium]
MTWIKQTHDQPLFPDLLWSRPERRDQAGKLLIIGGNLHGFSAPAEAFRSAHAAGIGTSRVVIPNALKRTLREILPEAQYSPSTPSGSFARGALSDWEEGSAWADAALLAGDFGHNSETALLLENFVAKHAGMLIVCQDAVEYFLARPDTITHRPQTLLVLSMGQLQKLAHGLHSTTPVTQTMGLPDLTSWLADFTLTHPIVVLTKHLDHLVVAYKGSVSTTPATMGLQPWRVRAGATASVWWLQHPTKPLESITSGILDL